MSQLRGFFTGSLFLLLTACGGGDNGSVTVRTGQFIDSAVSGIRYETESRSGITDSEGRFTYLDGEIVTFYLGELTLGNTHGAATVSLFDLVQGVDPVVGNTPLKKAISNRKREPGFSTVINLAVLLQTLDNDGNPDNGIDISADVAALLKPDGVDLNRYWNDFQHERGFRQVFNEAKASALLDSNRQIRKPWQAIAHLYQSLGIDSKLRPLTLRSYVNSLGFPTGFDSYEFNTSGQLVATGNVNSPSSFYHRSFGYNADGNLIHEEVDHNSDDRTDTFYTHTYNADGNLIRSVIVSPGHNPPATTSESTLDYSYNTEGRVIREDYDDNSDGNPETITYSSYDADGNLVRQTLDTIANGTPDSVTAYSYDAMGNRLHEEYDNDNDGTPESSSSYRYDAEGNLVHEERDRNGDGAPDVIIGYSFDANGRLLQTVNDWNGDGVTELTITYIYDAQGVLNSGEYDQNGDGIPDATDVYRYNDEGNPVSIETHFPNSSGAAPIERYEYDANADGWWWLFNLGAKGDGGIIL